MRANNHRGRTLLGGTKEHGQALVAPAEKVCFGSRAGLRTGYQAYDLLLV